MDIINKKRREAKDALEKKKQDMINKKEMKEKSWKMAKMCKIIIKELEGVGKILKMAGRKRKKKKKQRR